MGIDVSVKLVSVAAERFPHLQFRTHENYDIGGQEIFDYILIMDVNDQVDPIAALKALRPAMNERTRIIVHHYNHLWEPIIRLAERTGLKFPLPQQNWLSPATCRTYSRSATGSGCRSAGRSWYPNTFRCCRRWRILFFPVRP